MKALLAVTILILAFALVVAIRRQVIEHRRLRRAMTDWMEGNKRLLTTVQRVIDERRKTRSREGLERTHGAMHTARSHHLRVAYTAFVCDRVSEDEWVEATGHQRWNDREQGYATVEG